MKSKEEIAESKLDSSSSNTFPSWQRIIIGHHPMQTINNNSNRTPHIFLP
ncbi:hypothetical protein Hanom_Chr02g00130581 [Helianthus anomalus]